MEEKVFDIQFNSDVSIDRLGKGIHLSPKSKVELVTGGLCIKTESKSVFFRLSVDEETIVVCMSETAWEKLKAGYDVKYNTIQEHIKEIKDGRKRS